MNSLLRSIAVVLCVTASAAGDARAQPASVVQGLMRNAAVRAALEAARESEARTIDEQIRVCEVPAPPFRESARADVVKRTFETLGLERVRVDRAGNVLGDRPGTQPRGRLVVAAHLDTVFP